MSVFLKSLTLCVLAASTAAAPVQVLSSSLVKKSSSSSSKRGAAYNDASLVSTLSNSSATISWTYNWDMKIGGKIPEDIEYVPMMWGSGSVDDGWTSAVKKALKNGSTHILGFNEPDMSSEADMSASDAATYYKKYITPYADEATLVSPAVTSSTSTDEGLDWLESFLDDCDDCSVSAIAIHWYGGSVSDLKTFVNEAIDLASGYGISEVWLTEFGLSSDEDGISDLSTTATFLKEASEWLDEQSEVTRYAFFYCANDYMLTDSVANSVGEAYTSSSSSSSSSSESSSSETTSSSSSSSSESESASSSSSETTSSSDSQSSSSASISISSSSSSTESDSSSSASESASVSVSLSTETSFSSDTESSTSASTSVDITSDSTTESSQSSSSSSESEEESCGTETSSLESPSQPTSVPTSVASTISQPTKPCEPTSQPSSQPTKPSEPTSVPTSVASSPTEPTMGVEA